MCTHLHVDHVGWNTRLTDGQWVPTFPNATYVLSDADVVHWDPSNPRGFMRKGDPYNENVFEDSVAPLLSAGLVERWSGEHVIDGNLRVYAAPGHTPGNSAVRVESRGEKAVFIGDMMHSPIQVGLPHWNSCFCDDPAESRRSRVKTLEWASDNGALIFAGHFGGDRAVEVERQGSAFALKCWRGFSDD